MDIAVRCSLDLPQFEAILDVAGQPQGVASLLSDLQYSLQTDAQPTEHNRTELFKHMKSLYWEADEATQLCMRNKGEKGFVNLLKHSSWVDVTAVPVLIAFLWSVFVEKTKEKYIMQHYKVFATLTMVGDHEGVRKMLISASPPNRPLSCLTAMLRYENHLPYHIAASNGDLSMLTLLVQGMPENLRNKIDFARICICAVTSGKPNVVNYIIEEASRAGDTPSGLHMAQTEALLTAINMDQWDVYYNLVELFRATRSERVLRCNYSLFLAACGASNSAYLAHWYAHVLPDETARSIALCYGLSNLDTQYEGVVRAAVAGNLNNLQFLFNCVNHEPSQLIGMVTAVVQHTYRAVSIAVLGLVCGRIRREHVTLSLMLVAVESRCLTLLQRIYHVCSPVEWQALVEEERFRVFNRAVSIRWAEGAALLLAHSGQCCAYAVDHTECDDISATFFSHVLSDLQSRQQDFELTNPNGVFDVANTEEAVQCFHILRLCLRFSETETDNESTIVALLQLPSLVAMAHKSLSEVQPSAMLTEHQRPNELLRLAIRYRSVVAARVLLNIPAVDDAERARRWRLSAQDLEAEARRPPAKARAVGSIAIFSRDRAVSAPGQAQQGRWDGSSLFTTQRAAHQRQSRAEAWEIFWRASCNETLGPDRYLIYAERLLRDYAARHTAPMQEGGSGVESEGLGLRNDAQYRESSMRGLNETETTQLQEVFDKYAPAGARLNTLDAIREVLIARYLQNPAKISLGTTEDHIDLPVQWAQFKDLRLSPAQHALALKAYYRHPDHTALRYLSDPNMWLHEKCDFLAPGTRCSTFRHHEDLISVLYTAASDETTPATVGFTVESRVELFVKALALIGRAHNMDKRRPSQVDRSGWEEYDDLEGDRPSCHGGVKRRLLQSVLGHPLLQGLSTDGVSEELRTFTRACFARAITVDLKQAWERFISELDGDALQALDALNITPHQQVEFDTHMCTVYGVKYSENKFFAMQVRNYFRLSEVHRNHAQKFAGSTDLDGLFARI